MSKHPTERVRSVAEMQATSLQQSDKALRRMASAEARIANLEARLAERDELINEFREAYGRQADTLNAMGAVVKELEAKIARGVDQVLTGLEGRIAEQERQLPIVGKELRELISIGQDAAIAMDERLSALESKPKRGRPKGSKNKPKPVANVESGPDIKIHMTDKGPRGEPKSTPAVEMLKDELPKNNPHGGDSSNPEASDG